MEAAEVDIITSNTWKRSYSPFTTKRSLRRSKSYEIPSLDNGKTFVCCKQKTRILVTSFLNMKPQNYAD